MCTVRCKHEYVSFSHLAGRKRNSPAPILRRVRSRSRRGRPVAADETLADDEESAGGCTAADAAVTAAAAAADEEEEEADGTRSNSSSRMVAADGGAQTIRIGLRRESLLVAVGTQR